MLDIEYLLLLQNLREKAGPGVEKLALFISDIPISLVSIALFAILYWSISKRIGAFVLLSQTIGAWLINVVKLSVCCYRPWVRDPRVQPGEGVLKNATGYSFPSGHSQSVTGEYGALGYSLWKDKKVLSVICWIVVPLVMFTRNFLGVHTPQDVLVGFAIGLLIIFFVDFLLKWEAKGENRDLWILGGTVVLCLATILFILLKKYPMDYDANGALLVDPEKMKKDFFSNMGPLLASVLGWVLEKRFIKFSTEKNILCKILRPVTGLLFLGLVAFGFSFVKPLMHPFVYYTLKYFSLYFVVVFLHPLLFTAVENAIDKKKNPTN